LSTICQLNIMIQVLFLSLIVLLIFFLNDTATTEIYTLSLHDALPIWRNLARSATPRCCPRLREYCPAENGRGGRHLSPGSIREVDRKSTRLNSSHLVISYAVFCLKKKKKKSAS